MRQLGTTKLLRSFRLTGRGIKAGISEADDSLRASFEMGTDMSTTKKKESKGKEGIEETPKEQSLPKITTKTELRAFIATVRDKLINQSAPPIYAMSALNHVMSLPEIYDLMDTQMKESLQEIWVKLSQAGMHIHKPALLFGDA